MVPRTPKHTQKSHPHTHWGALVPSRIIRPEIKKHSACQLPAAQWRSQQPTSAICVGVWEPPYPPYTHTRTHDVESNFCWSRSSAALRRHVEAKRTQMNRGSHRVTFSKNVPESDHVMWPSGREWWESIELKEAKWKSCFHHHTAFTRTDRGDVRSARNEPK